MSAFNLQVPGTQFQHGYNFQDGDKDILWSTQPMGNTWVDHELQKTNTI